MATRWVDGVPLRRATAKEVADGCLTLFSRMGIPLKILSDNGTQFVSSLLKDVCSLFGIAQIQVSPYRPQSNGVLERVHGVLKPLLSKANDKGLDWVGFLPLAMFSIRQLKNKDLQFSPHELVFGTNLRGPIDCLYAGWVESPLYAIDVSNWILQLQEKLEILRDHAHISNCESSEKRKATLDKNKSFKQLTVNESVMIRIPGLHTALNASWEGPFIVTEVVGPVTVKVKRDKNDKQSKIVHMNNCKRVWSREAVVYVAILAENEPDHEKIPILEGECEGYNKADIDKLIDRHKVIFSDKPGETDLPPMEINIQEGTPPVCQKAHAIPLKLRQSFKNELDALLTDGIIERSTSEWSSPVIPLPKPNGSLRLCVDYRAVNKVTQLSRTWIPRLEEMVNKIGHSSVISKIDLAKGYHQIKVHPNSMDITTLICPYGKFKYKRVPFGLKNAPTVFQEAIAKVLGGLEYFSANYIDDIIVFSGNWQEHLVHLKKVFRALKRHGLTAKPAKCEFGKCKLVYLGHLIGQGTLSIPEHKIANLVEYAQPVTVKQLRSFIGTYGHYRKSIPGFATIAAVLFPATSSRAPRRVVWTDEMVAAFSKLKTLLANNIVLNTPQENDTLKLQTDASGTGLGTVLYAVRNNEELPVAFHSRQLNSAEKNYSITELETLAIVDAVKHFSIYRWGNTFEVITDHKPCSYIVRAATLNNRLRRFMLYLQQFDLKITYVPGKENVVPDGLSRQPVTHTTESQTPQARDVFAGGDVGEAPTHIKKKEGGNRKAEK